MDRLPGLLDASCGEQEEGKDNGNPESHRVKMCPGEHNLTGTTGLILPSGIPER